MITLNLTLPEAVFAEYADAADKLNQRFGDAKKPTIDGKTLMAFALARHESGDICSQFDLALRLVTGEAGGMPRPLPNPVLK
ncbi:MAG: hypothetical protein PSW75_04265 [bacterium]|nr:hypothetical protein [bacterium]